MSRQLSGDVLWKTVLFTVTTLVISMGTFACAPATNPGQGSPELSQSPSEAPVVPTQASEVPRVSREELLQKLESGAGVLIVDTRAKTDYDSGYIKGAVSVPLSTIQEKQWQPPADVEVVLYCS